MKRSFALALGVVAALAFPAVASAHPGVFTVTQTYRPTGQTCQYVAGDPTSDDCLATRVQYAVANDGYALSFTESNNLPAGGGLINYRALPGGWRDTMPADTKRTWPDAQTNLQAHATCAGTALDQGPNILAWQDEEDPFFNYVPWQSTTAGIGDLPSEWIPTVRSVTGVDLTGMSAAQAQAACANAGGTYRAADTSAGITGEMLAAAARPLQSQITTLQTSLTALEAVRAATEVRAMNAERGVGRSLKLTLSAKRFDQGVAMITGAPGTAVSVRALLSSADARKLKLARTISTRTTTLDASGARLLNLTLTTKARRAIDRHLPALNVTVEATAGAVKQTAAGTLTR